MNKEIKRYINYFFTEGCSDRCNDAAIEEESPPFVSMTWDDFIEKHTDNRIAINDPITIDMLLEARTNAKIVEKFKHKLDTMNTKGEMDLTWVHEVFSRCLKV